MPSELATQAGYPQQTELIDSQTHPDPCIYGSTGNGVAVRGYEGRAELKL